MARVYVLGAGTPTPTAQRFGTSYVLKLDNEQVMFDCGPAATDKLVKSGLFPTNITHLFFTHHHFDHDVDYPCFLLCRWDQSIGIEKELQVFGPTLTEQLTPQDIGRKRRGFCSRLDSTYEPPGEQENLRTPRGLTASETTICSINRHISRQGVQRP